MEWILDACGVTRSGNAIPVLIHPDANSMESTGIRVVLIGGLMWRNGEIKNACVKCRNTS